MKEKLATIKKASVKRMWRLKVFDIGDDIEVHNDTYGTEEDAKEVIVDGDYIGECYEVTLEEVDVIDEQVLDKALRLALKSGIKDGLKRYAWWKSGVQYVGTCGTTLKKALEDVDKEFSQSPTSKLIGL